jgi:hypothetical protein
LSEKEEEDIGVMAAMVEMQLAEMTAFETSGKPVRRI